MIGFNNSKNLQEEDTMKVIKNIDYQELEDKYDLLKYYPKYIHNGVSTPRIKDMLGGIPIYADANKHVKKKKRQPCIKQPHGGGNPYDNSTSYTYSTRQARKGSYFDHSQSYQPSYDEEKTTDDYGDELCFRDPFADIPKHNSNLNQGNPTHEKGHHDTFTTKDGEHTFYPLKKSESYDQTRSIMTSDRHLKGNFVFTLKNKLFNRITSTRKNSVNSTYIFILHQVDCALKLFFVSFFRRRGNPFCYLYPASIQNR